MDTRNWFRRVAGIGAALSLGGMAFLTGCNHDNDCCDTRPGPIIHEHHEHADAGDNRIEVQPGQATAYDNNDRAIETGVSEPALEQDTYFRQHRLDSGFERDAYFRDRAAYVRAHEGNDWWNDHRVELEASWGDRRHDGRDNRDNRRAVSNTGFDREMNSVQHPPTERSTRELDSKEREPISTSAQERDSIKDSRGEKEPGIVKENRLDNRGTSATPNSEAGTPKKDLDNGRDRDANMGASTTKSDEKTRAPKQDAGTPSSNNPGSESKKDMDNGRDNNAR